MSKEQTLAQHRAEIARLEHRATQGDVDRSKVDQARREYTEAKLAATITQVVDSMPPLTDAQRERLAQLLSGGPDTATVRDRHE